MFIKARQVFRVLLRFSSRVHIAFEERPETWDEAVESCGGWSADEILMKVLAASLQVRDGTAIAERDGIILPQAEQAWPVISGVLWQALRDEGEARVLDFGGSLGSSYRQMKPFAAGLSRFAWAIVEQPAFVEAGRKYFSDDELSFHSTIDRASQCISPNTILCSGTLNYLPNPSETIQSFAMSGAATLILDRVAVHEGDEDILAVQTVAGTPYAARLPFWILSRARLEEQLAQEWVIVARFCALDGKQGTLSGRHLEWIGLILTRTDEERDRCVRLPRESGCAADGA